MRFKKLTKYHKWYRYYDPMFQFLHELDKKFVFSYRNDKWRFMMILSGMSCIKPPKPTSDEYIKEFEQSICDYIDYSYALF